MSESDFRARVLPMIPPLAWLFSFDEDVPTLFQGSAVDLLPNGFFEGCYAAPFGDDPRSIANVFGSGMVVDSAGYHFVTPSHTLECLYFWKRDRVLGVSNSLAFLVEHFGLDVPIDYDYPKRFLSVMWGIDVYDRHLFATGGGNVERVTYHNLTVGLDGEAREIEKPIDRGFSSFEDYVGYAQGVLHKSFGNAGTSGRQGTYKPIGTVSSGYDSGASLALACELGCNDALTLRQSRDEQNDSGSEVGRALGVRVHEFDRPDIARLTIETSSEHFATGLTGEDYSYSVFEGQLYRRVLLTAFPALVWDLDGKATDDLHRKDVCGASMQEFRLRANFFHIPVPVVGVRHPRDIEAISISPDMELYRGVAGYSKPIPRRILESAGVSGQLFGQDKKAASTLFDWGCYGIFTDQKDIERFHHAASQAGVDIESRAYRARLGRWELLYPVYNWLIYRLRRPPMSRIPRTKLIHDFCYKGRHNHPGRTAMFLVALKEVSKRYRDGSQ